MDREAGMANRTVPNIDQALDNPKLLGQFMVGGSWSAWRTLWRSAYALAPQPGDLEMFRECTGRQNWPSLPAEELWALIGRRGGKSINIGLQASYTAAFGQYPNLAVGERAVIPIISPVRAQSQIIKGYVSSFFRENSFLRSLILLETSDRIELMNKVTILIMSSDFRSLRGYSSPLVVLEEASFFRSEGSKTDTEIVRAVRPALATLGGLLCVISSPFAKEGAVWETYSKWYGVEGRILVWRAPSRFMNPLIGQDVVDKAMSEDPEAARSEWEGEFRSDISSYVSPEVIDGVTARGCHQRSPLDGILYSSFCDMAGGSGQDSATLGIAHKEGGKAVLDCLREVHPPFSPEETVKEFSETLKRYKCDRVKGDRWAGDWPKEKFSQHAISYEAESRSKSELYIELLPLLNSGQVELLDNETLKRQLRSLERRTHAGGKQSVDHPARGHDDLANSCAGSLLLAAVEETSPGFFFAGRGRRPMKEFHPFDPPPENSKMAKWLRGE